jgi:N-acyl-D-aspartate/D-glutamate deacylase
VHARFYGTFPRKIRHFALDKGVIGVEDAVRSSTGLPARILGLTERGTLRAGAYADIVIMDPVRIRDTATFFQPHQYPEGIDWVFIKIGLDCNIYVTITKYKFISKLKWNKGQEVTGSKLILAEIQAMDKYN